MPDHVYMVFYGIARRGIHVTCHDNDISARVCCIQNQFRLILLRAIVRGLDFRAILEVIAMIQGRHLPAGTGQEVFLYRTAFTDHLETDSGILGTHKPCCRLFFCCTALLVSRR